MNRKHNRIFWGVTGGALLTITLVLALRLLPVAPVPGALPLIPRSANSTVSDIVKIMTDHSGDVFQLDIVRNDIQAVPVSVLLKMKSPEHDKFAILPDPGYLDNILMPVATASGIRVDAIVDPETRVDWGQTQRHDNPLFSIVNLIFIVLPIVLVVSLIWFQKKKGQLGGGKDAQSFAKNKAKLHRPDPDKKVSWGDVAGVDDAKTEVEELVDYLKDPSKIKTMGGKAPKGVLFVGPPGTGKTLLARAIADEAGVPFYSTSGSDFVEMFVGAGAARVRDLFDEARKNAPCIIFFDEVDAVGQTRGAGIGGGNDERQQTLNQLLVELDGVELLTGVLVIAATNRPDILDPALLRPGRLGDLRVTVDVADVKGRHDQLRVHARNKPLAPDVNLEQIARITFGYSGAELADVFNQGIIVALRRIKGVVTQLVESGLSREEAEGRVVLEVTQADLSEAIGRVKMGPSSTAKSRRLSPATKRTLAIHEAGHAVVSHVLNLSTGGKAGAPVRKVTIIGAGGAGGYMLAVPEDDNMLLTSTSLRGMISVALGGTVSERLFLKDITTGASSDIDRAYDIAKRMVTRYGMSSLGPISVGEDGGSPFLGMKMAASGGYGLGAESANQIDAQIKSILDEAVAVSTTILRDNAAFLTWLVPIFVEEETLNEQRWNQLWTEFHRNPGCGC